MAPLLSASEWLLKSSLVPAALHPVDVHTDRNAHQLLSMLAVGGWPGVGAWAGGAEALGALGGGLGASDFGGAGAPLSVCSCQL
ncbi:hypothetical protein A5703_07450 [Mycobacterium sp. E188]|nr:hypothetical protein A5703_07450 [Mycobacterium sp. E188]OBH41088.1 hypothetical protein A5691_19375 [Mycobacterium sp. E183]